MTPSYILSQLDCSRRNLDVECIDIYYVHNPETQLAEVSREEFHDRLLKAFEALEGAVTEGKIRFYGTPLGMLIATIQELRITSV
jgi:aryl-alcohol dehydrogenase-like predicted oxidoreductase